MYPAASFPHVDPVWEPCSSEAVVEGVDVRTLLDVLWNIDVNSGDTRKYASQMGLTPEHIFQVSLYTRIPETDKREAHLRPTKVTLVTALGLVEILERHGGDTATARHPEQNRVNTVRSDSIKEA